MSAVVTFGVEIRRPIDFMNDGAAKTAACGETVDATRTLVKSLFKNATADGVTLSEKEMAAVNHMLDLLDEKAFAAHEAMEEICQAFDGGVFSC